MEPVNNSKFVTILTPDPSWDYYELWHTLQLIKSDLDFSIKLLSETEENNEYVSETVNSSLNRIDELVEKAKGEF